jgi:serine/threonine-protein kinase
MELSCILLVESSCAGHRKDGVHLADGSRERFRRISLNGAEKTLSAHCTYLAELMGEGYRPPMPKTFAERWSELSDADVARLSVDETITARTLLDRGPKLPKREKQPPPEPPAALPFISMAWPDDDRRGQRPKSSRAPDLSVGPVLGAGGMGQVRVARQHSLGRDVAIKLLNDGADEGLRESLIQEAIMTGSLTHPGVIPVHALGLDDGDKPVLVMERVDGVSWHDLLTDPDNASWHLWQERAGSRLPANLEIMSQVCDAVDFAHSRGIVHRDIKPQNVMLGNFGEVYLVDWGLAVRIDREPDGLLVGTPSFMAPEMAAGERVDERTDVYLLGATLHQVVTGGYRHEGDAVRSVLLSAYESAPIDYAADVPSLLADLCNRATAASPEDRPQSAKEFRGAIGEFLRRRSSVAFSDAARRSLAKLEALKVDGELSPDDLFAANSFAAEARFGFAQALDEWNENDAAVSGLEDCLAATADIHLRRRDAHGTRTVLDHMQEPPAELFQRLEDLDTELEHAKAEKERLDKLDHDLDKSAGMGGKMVALCLLLVFGLTVTVIANFQEGGLDAVTQGQALALSSVLLIGTILTAVVTRKKLMVNAFNRRVVAFSITAIAMLVFHRAIAWAISMPLHYVFVGDLLMFSMGAAFAAFALYRWMIFGAIALAIASVLAAFVPSHAAMIFYLGTAGASLIIVLLWRRAD